MNPKTIKPLTLPSLPLADRSQLPVCPAVYFVWDGNPKECQGCRMVTSACKVMSTS
ncbi:hypothetical protein [Microcoleus sp. CAWBG58]|uniref:hypothetical protein n=1 Tax=Microcoleus sp. CAWBG58 TaxID=2841651 RepID=UPI0025EC7266|nr:hypothetical protein [Microcoleus sp. CAWBG58]